MRAPYTQLYVQIIWSTWDRLPLIRREFLKRLYGVIRKNCLEMNCRPLAIGAVDDHVHLLVRLHPAVAVSGLVKQVKGSSSHLLHQEILAGQAFFKWQGGYRAFSLKESDIPRLKHYIMNQAQHHAEDTVRREWEPPRGD